MDTLRLSTREMWEATYREGAPSNYASPETRCGAFELVRVFRNYLPRTDVRLLEMGCGGSKYLPWLGKELGYSVEGVDYTRTGCESARKNLRAAGVEGEIHCEDFLNLPERFGSSYDVVTSYGVIEHFADPSVVLKSFARCLKPGGSIVTFVPNMAGLPGYLLKKINRPLFDTHFLFGLEEFASYHRNANLVPIHARYSEWCDLALLPDNKFGPKLGFALKNVVYYANRVRLAVMKRWPSFDPQSAFLCSGMIVVARRE